MNRLASPSSSVHGRVVAWSRGQWVLRVLIVVGVLGALLATAFDGPWPALWLILATAASAAVWAAFPESAAGAVALGLVITWWGIGLDQGLTWWCLLAVAGLLLAHVAALLASYGPGEQPVVRAAVVRWAARGLLLLALAALVLVTLRWLGGDAPADAPAGVWLSGTACAVLVVGGVLALYPRLRRG